MRKYTLFMSLAMWAFIILLITQCACGMQANTSIPTPSNDVNIESPDVQIPAQVLAVEPLETKAAPRYVTTAPLNVRAEANADSNILGTLAEGVEVVIFIPIPELRGDDCYLGEWYETRWGEATAYVCSLYVQEK